MKFIKVLETDTEAEALMYKEMLENSSIKALTARPNTQQFLSANWGGASLPFDIYEIFVDEKHVEKAKEILPEQKTMVSTDTKPKQVFKGFAIIWIISIVVGGIVILLAEFLN